MKKKVAILTLRLHSNFGYLMQVYALQKIVRSLGHEPYTFYIKEEQPSFKAKVKEVVYNLYVKCFKGEQTYIFKKWITDDERETLDKNTWDFIKKEIQLTEYIRTPRDFYTFDTSNYDAYIVGSDQVWREPYSISLPLYFFSFLDSEKKRMSYAASFGRSDINEYSSNQKKQCKELLQKFSIVTVREKDGVDICMKEFGINAKQVVDPTLLLPEEDYIKLANKGAFQDCKESFVFAYILDPNPYKWDIINKYASEKDLKVVNIIPSRDISNIKSLEDYIYPHVYDILSGFANAAFVFTDSFHASVFSIIFRRQFFVFPNEKRGNSRILSLLEDYGLSDRLLSGVVSDSYINYDTISPSVSLKIKESKEYLNSFLNE